jgi:hypothetical protein
MGGKPEDPYLDLDVIVDPDERFLLIGSLGRSTRWGRRLAFKGSDPLNPLNP